MPPKSRKPKSAGSGSTAATRAASSSKSTKPASAAAATTTRKRALDAVSNNSESDGDNKPVSKKTKQDTSKDAKMVTVIKQTSVPVDPHSGLVLTHRVYEDHSGVWDAMLNQTDISGNTNSNKFYVLQILHSGKNDYFLFTRWGRVGEIGAYQFKGPWESAAVAIDFFRKQFRSKAGTDWDSRHGMVAKKGKYVFIERDFEDSSKNAADGPSTSGEPKEDTKVPDSTLAPEIQEFCQVIFSTKLLDAHLSEMNYDANKLPLGKLSKASILKGFEVLKELAEVIEDPNPAKFAQSGGINEVCAELSGRYYSLIPHNFGRARPTIISNMSLLKHELEVLDNLGEMEVAHKIITSNSSTDEDGNVVNPLDMHFNSLGLSMMEPVGRESKEFDVLQAYVHDTHGHTHAWYKVNVQHIFRIGRDAENQAFSEAGYDSLEPGQRLLLWHGSRSTNFAGILKQGLRIAPPEAPVTGYMFGKGIYLADMMSKSANYCYAHLSNGTGILLLCEAAVKPFNELQNALYNADQECKKHNALATKGVGRFQPVDWQDAGAALDRSELSGVSMPKGKGSDATQSSLSLQYNEYIVYSVSQIRLRYLLMVNMSS